MSEENKKTLLELFNAWGPAILTILLPGGVGIVGYNNGLSLKIAIIFSVALFIMLIIYFKFFHTYLKAIFYQWRIGKFKGLWRDKALKSQVKRCFLNASRIRIKVTRGTELINNNHDNVNIVEELETLKRISSSTNPIHIQILLMAPCFKVKHVKNRYETHKGKYSTPNDFLKSWSETFSELVKYEDDYCTISVRFYYGGHSRWRFYICSDDNDDKQIVLLGNYDDDTSGTKTPMYKIIKGEKNIGAFMDKYFDEIWNNSINLLQLIESIKNEKCLRLFCEECKYCTDQSNICDTKCSAENCNLNSDCKARAEEWEEFLKNLSRTQKTNFLN